MDRLNITQLSQFVPCAPGGKLRRGKCISGTGIAVADIGGEELNKAARGTPVGCEQARQ
jgi:hypothetical protein